MARKRHFGNFEGHGFRGHITDNLSGEGILVDGLLSVIICFVSGCAALPLMHGHCRLSGKKSLKNQIAF